jgi:hypothetical protein
LTDREIPVVLRRRQRQNNKWGGGSEGEDSTRESVVPARLRSMEA